MTPEKDRAPDQPIDPNRWLDQYGDALYGYAVVRTKDASLAEDLVQETFLAAWKGRSQFAGRSTEKTWLFGILKNKIADHLRRLARETPLLDANSLSDTEASAFEPSGRSKHAWTPLHGPQSWSHPEQGLEKEEFWKVLADCTDKLPRPLARSFIMREMEAIETAEICQVLNISPNHLWVMLHRARLALRRCLELNWFKSPDHHHLSA